MIENNRYPICSICNKDLSNAGWGSYGCWSCGYEIILRIEILCPACNSKWIIYPKEIKGIPNEIIIGTEYDKLCSNSNCPSNDN